MPLTDYYLGLNCAHDAAACLVSADGVRVAVREERLVRRKYVAGFPERAVAHCLRAAGLSHIRDVAGVVINQYPQRDHDRAVRALGYRGDIVVNPSHHLLHAHYAHYVTGGADAAIAVVDGSGYSYGEYLRRGSAEIGTQDVPYDHDEADSVYVAAGGHLRAVHRRWGEWRSVEPYFRFPSLGHMYAVATQYIFQSAASWVHAGKVMGLAPYGDAARFDFPLVRFADGRFAFDLDWVYRLPEQGPIRPDYWTDLVKTAVAAKVQNELEVALLAYLRWVRQTTGCDTLCLTGGVALNSVANGKLLAERVFSRVFLTPAADDAGTAIGAALYGLWKRTGRLPAKPYRTDFHGPAYPDSEVASVVEADPRVAAERFDSVEAFAADAARELAAGAAIGLFDGGSEFGPRALGHRSILCDPRGADTKDRLNARVKFREAYRPYAAAVLAAHAADYFACHAPDPFMMTVADVLPHRREEIPAVTHVDGTCRIQTIHDDYDGGLRPVLEAFHRATGLPLLLNTSLNIRGEPIVETPQEAVNCLCSTGLDFLYAYPFKLVKHIKDVPRVAVWKTLVRESPGWSEFQSLVPMVNPDMVLEVEQRTESFGWELARATIRSRTGNRFNLNSSLYWVLTAINGRDTVGDIMRALESIRTPWHPDGIITGFPACQQTTPRSYRDSTEKERRDEFEYYIQREDGVAQSLQELRAMGVVSFRKSEQPMATPAAEISPPGDAE